MSRHQVCDHHRALIDDRISVTDEARSCIDDRISVIDDRGAVTSERRVVVDAALRGKRARSSSGCTRRGILRVSHFLLSNMQRSLIVLLTLLGLASPYAAGAEGDLDMTFGSAGVALLESGDSGPGYVPIQIQADGRIVTCTHGISADGLRYTNFIGRLNADGSRDETFGANGLVDTHSIGPPDCMGLVLQEDGHIVVAQIGVADEQVPHADTEIVLERFDAEGRPDESFGNGTGTVRVNLVPGSSDGFIMRLTSQPDGRLVVAGAVLPAQFVVARRLADGSPDESFGVHGFSRMILTNAYASGVVGTLFIDEIGRIVLAGTVAEISGDQHGQFAVARFLPDGSPDDHFGRQGLVTIFDAPSAFATVAIPLGDGRIVLAGFTCQTSTSPDRGCDIELARLLESGAIDRSFGQDGTRTIAIDRTEHGLDYVMSGVRRPQDGKILLVGSAEGAHDQRSGLILLIDPDGVPDEAFGALGAPAFDVLPNDDRSEYFTGVASTSGRTIILGGAFGYVSGSLNTSTDFAIALEADVPTRGHSLHGRVGPLPPAVPIPLNRMR
jgi:uncharacterized delta-60 repeat protein